MAVELTADAERLKDKGEGCVASKPRHFYESLSALELVECRGVQSPSRRVRGSFMWPFERVSIPGCLSAVTVLAPGGFQESGRRICL